MVGSTGVRRPPLELRHLFPSVPRGLPSRRVPVEACRVVCPVHPFPPRFGDEQWSVWVGIRRLMKGGVCGGPPKSRGGSFTGLSVCSYGEGYLPSEGPLSESGTVPPVRCPHTDTVSRADPSRYTPSVPGSTATGLTVSGRVCAGPRRAERGVVPTR